MTKINIPEVAISEVLLGKAPAEVLERCEISGVFERREWMATASTIGVLAEYMEVQRGCKLRLLANGIYAMCDRDRKKKRKLQVGDSNPAKS